MPAMRYRTPCAGACMQAGDGDDLPVFEPESAAAVFALMLDGDVVLPPGSQVYALKPGISGSTVAASDMIA